MPTITNYHPLLAHIGPNIAIAIVIIMGMAMAMSLAMAMAVDMVLVWSSSLYCGIV